MYDIYEQFVKHDTQSMAPYFAFRLRESAEATIKVKDY